MAIKALAWMVRVFEPPVYCYHEIVHNQIVVDRFRRLGVVFVDDVADVPAGAPLMLSAHGSGPEVVAAARANGGVVVDAVCPLVTKVHHEVKVRAGKGYTVVYVGHEGHDEAVGTMAVAPEAVRLVETEDDVGRLDIPADAPVAFLAQTTLSMDDWSGVRDAAADRFPAMWMPQRSDLCFATTNRQTALKAVAARADALVVIGSANSSNTRAMENVARALCPTVVRVNGPDEVPADLAGTVGVTAGASAPEELVRAVIDRLAPVAGVELVSVTDEEEYFPPPRELRELLRAAVSAVSASLFAPPDETSPLANDRTLAASAVLDDLSLTPRVVVSGGREAG